MRRRQQETASPVPEDLATYEPAVWRSRGGVAGWCEARLVWLWANRDAVDPVEFLGDNLAVKRAATGAGS